MINQSDINNSNMATGNHIAGNLIQTTNQAPTFNFDLLDSNLQNTIKSKLKGFIGRIKDIENVSQYLEKYRDSGGLILINGNKGCGLTSFMAKLIDNDNQSIYFICNKSTTSKSIIEYLSYKLNKKYPKLLKSYGNLSNSRDLYINYLSVLSNNSIKEVVYIDSIHFINEQDYLEQLIPDIRLAGITFVLSSSNNRDNTKINSFYEYDTTSYSLNNLNLDDIISYLYLNDIKIDYRFIYKNINKINTRHLLVNNKNLDKVKIEFKVFIEEYSNKDVDEVILTVCLLQDAVSIYSLSNILGKSINNILNIINYSNGYLYLINDIVLFNNLLKDDYIKLFSPKHIIPDIHKKILKWCDVNTQKSISRNKNLNPNELYGYKYYIYHLYNTQVDNQILLKLLYSLNYHKNISYVDKSNMLYISDISLLIDNSCRYNDIYNLWRLKLAKLSLELMTNFQFNDIINIYSNIYSKNDINNLRKDPFKYIVYLVMHLCKSQSIKEDVIEILKFFYENIFNLDEIKIISTLILKNHEYIKHLINLSNLDIFFGISFIHIESDNSPGFIDVLNSSDETGKSILIGVVKLSSLPKNISNYIKNISNITENHINNNIDNENLSILHKTINEINDNNALSTEDIKSLHKIINSSSIIFNNPEYNTIFAFNDILDRIKSVIITKINNNLLDDINNISIILDNFNAIQINEIYYYFSINLISKDLYKAISIFNMIQEHYSDGKSDNSYKLYLSNFNYYLCIHYVQINELDIALKNISKIIDHENRIDILLRLNRYSDIYKYIDYFILQNKPDESIELILKYIDINLEIKKNLYTKLMDLLENNISNESFNNILNYLSINNLFNEAINLIKSKTNFPDNESIDSRNTLSVESFKNLAIKLIDGNQEDELISFLKEFNSNRLDLYKTLLILPKIKSNDIFRDNIINTIKNKVNKIITNIYVHKSSELLNDFKSELLSAILHPLINELDEDSGIDEDQYYNENYWTFDDSFVIHPNQENTLDNYSFDWFDKLEQSVRNELEQDSAERATSIIIDALASVTNFKGFIGITSLIHLLPDTALTKTQMLTIIREIINQPLLYRQ